MAYSYSVTAIPSEVPTTLVVPFKYLLTEHVSVYINTVEFALRATDWNSSNIISTARMGLLAGDVVRIQRDTPFLEPVVNFAAGADTSEKNLDKAHEQLLFVVQEKVDSLSGMMQLDTDDRWDALGKTMKRLGTPIEDTDAATKGYADTTINAAKAYSIAAEASKVAAAASEVEAAGYANAANVARAAAYTAQLAAEAAQHAAENARDEAQAAADSIGDVLSPGDIGVTVQAYDEDIVKAPGGVLPPLDGSRLTGLARGLNVAPQTVLTAPTGSKISGWADGDQDAPVLSLHTASDIGDTYYSAERVDASLAAGEIGVAAGIVVAYAWEGAVHQSSPSPSELSLELSGAADGVYHIYADLNADGSWAGVGYSTLYPAYGTARLTPGSDLYNTATVRMYDGADNAVRRVYVGRVEMAGGVPTEVVEAPIGTSVKIPIADGALLAQSSTYVEPNPFSGSASIELELYYRTRASATDIRWQRVDSVQFLSSNSRIFGSAPTCINADVAIVSTGNWALAPYIIYHDGVYNCPGRIKLTRGF